MLRLISLFAIAALLQQCSYSQPNPVIIKTEKMDSIDKKPATPNPVYSTKDKSKVNLSESEWQKILPAEVYHVARQKGTERPWTSKFENFNEKGT
jgi:peptide-methionine (R)-S-oxide reductase